MLLWVKRTFPQSGPGFSRWLNDKRPLPEAVIRFYLMHQQGRGAEIKGQTLPGAPKARGRRSGALSRRPRGAAG